uniref:Uncharacterized protein n=1 Tax=Plectus sambesii TaxID=2011161 RepID=A0A914XGU3_9BILA
MATIGVEINKAAGAIINKVDGEAIKVHGEIINEVVDGAAIDKVDGAIINKVDLEAIEVVRKVEGVAIKVVNKAGRALLASFLEEDDNLKCHLCLIVELQLLAAS